MCEDFGKIDFTSSLYEQLGYEIEFEIDPAWEDFGKLKIVNPKIEAYNDGFLAGSNGKYCELAPSKVVPSKFKDNLVEVWERAYEEGHKWSLQYKKSLLEDEEPLEEEEEE